MAFIIPLAKEPIFHLCPRVHLENSHFVCRAVLVASPCTITIWRLGLQDGPEMPYLGYLMTLKPGDKITDSGEALRSELGNKVPYDNLGKFYTYYRFNFSLDLVAQALFKVPVIRRMAWFCKHEKLYWHKSGK